MKLAAFWVIPDNPGEYLSDNLIDESPDIHFAPWAQ